MRLSFFYTKSIFLTSLACFSLGKQPVFSSSQFYLYQCDTSTCSTSTTCVTTTDAFVNTSYFGSGSNGLHAGSGCTSPTTSININFNTSLNPEFYLDANLSSDYYIYWSDTGTPSGTAYIKYDGDGSTLTLGAQLGVTEGVPTFVFQNSGSTPSAGDYNSIELSNSNNSFPIGTIFEIDTETELYLASAAKIVGVETINIYGGALQIDNEGTLSCDIGIDGASNLIGTISGGASSSDLLILTGQISGLAGGNFGYNKGALYLNNYIYLNSSVAATGTGIIINYTGTTQISSQNAFGTNAFGWGGQYSPGTNPTLQFVGNQDSIAITSDMVFNITGTAQSDSYYYSGNIDTNSNIVTWSGALSANPGTGSNASYLVVMDSNSANPGSLSLTGTVSEDLILKLNSGSLIFGLIGGTAVANSVIFNGGTLQVADITYSGAFTVDSGTIDVAGNGSSGSMLSGTLSGSGGLAIINSSATTQGNFTIENPTGYNGAITVGSNSGEGVALDIDLAWSTAPTTLPVITIYPTGNLTILNNNSGTGGTVYASVTTAGTPSGSSFPTLNFSNDGTAVATMTLAGSISGTPIINVGIDGFVVLATNDNDVSGVMSLAESTSVSGGSFVLSKATDVLTLLSNSLGPSQIYGNISGDGGVIIAGTTNFGNSTSLYPTNTFTGGLTLTSGNLAFWGLASLSTGTITGNGGTLQNEVGDVTISNNWTFVGGTTTSFEGGAGLMTLAGSFTAALGVNSASTVTLAGGSSVVAFTPSSLTLPSGTVLATNGNDITAATISGTGSILLGGTSHSSPAVDNLIISGSTTYSGNILDNNSGGGSQGAVYIQAPVTLSGINTFAGGLYLGGDGFTSAVLTINSGVNIGSSKGTIYFQGGGLTTSSGSGDVSTNSTNNLAFTNLTTTTITVNSTMLTLAGTYSISSSGGTSIAYITKEGAGILTIPGNSATFTEGGTYDLTVSHGTVSFNAPTSGSLAAIPFLEDGLLRGREEGWFALADASYANWKVMQVTPPPPAVINITVLDGSVLTGTGEVTTIEAKPGANIVPGDEGMGVFTVTDYAIFDEGSKYIIRTNGSSTALLDVVGLVEIGSHVDVLIAPQAGNYINGNYVILDAGTLSGRFADLSVPSSFFLGVALNYSVPNEVILSVNPRTIKGSTSNTQAVADSLNTVINWNRTHVSYDVPSITSSNPAFPLLGELLATLEPLRTEVEMTEALNQLQPAFFKGFTVVQEDNIVKVQDALSLRMNYVLNTTSCYSFMDKKECCDKDSNIIHTWISGIGDVLAQESNTFKGSPQVGYQSKMGGFVTGVDGHFAKVVYLGAMGGYTTSYIKWRGHQGTGNINTGYAGIYLSALGKMFYGNLSLIGGFSDFSGRRHIEYPLVDITAKGNHAGKQLLSHADTGINWNLGGFTIRPFDAFDYITQSETGYIEEGVGEWGLTLHKTNAILLRNELGLELSTCLCFSHMKWVIAPKASWIREVRVKGDSYTASFTKAALADAPFTVTGYFPNRNLFSPGISLTGSMCQDRLSVELNYNGVFNHGYSDHSYAGEIRYGF